MVVVVGVKGGEGEKEDLEIRGQGAEVADATFGEDGDGLVRLNGGGFVEGVHATADLEEYFFHGLQSARLSPNCTRCRLENCRLRSPAHSVIIFALAAEAPTRRLRWCRTPQSPLSTTPFCS